jgi:hypothetical protein
MVHYLGHQDLTPLDFSLWDLNERDDLQDQFTHERGTAASGYGYCCLCMRTPQNDSVGSKLLFGMIEAVH